MIQQLSAVQAVWCLWLCYTVGRISAVLLRVGSALFWCGASYLQAVFALRCPHSTQGRWKGSPWHSGHCWQQISPCRFWTTGFGPHCCCLLWGGLYIMSPHAFVLPMYRSGLQTWNDFSKSRGELDGNILTKSPYQDPLGSAQILL